MEKNNAAWFDERLYLLKVINYIVRVMASINDSNINNRLINIFCKIHMQGVFEYLCYTLLIAMFFVHAPHFVTRQFVSHNVAGLLIGRRIDCVNVCLLRLAADVGCCISMCRPKF